MRGAVASCLSPCQAWVLTGYAFNYSNPFTMRDPSGMEPEAAGSGSGSGSAPAAKPADTVVLYILPKDITHVVKGQEHRWTITDGAMRAQYERALGAFLGKSGLLSRGARVEYGQLTNVRDVANAVTKIATVLPSPAAGTRGDAIKADDFAKLLSGSGVKTTTILGCDTVSNKFAPNLADVLPAGGTVKAFAGSSLELWSRTDASKTITGTLDLQSLRVKGSLQVRSFKTKGP